jgi:hypothetical protein
MSAQAVAVGLAMSALLSVPTLAETPTPTPAETPTPSLPATSCFDVVPTASDASPNAPIMIDRCTGRTWLLVRTPLDKDGASFTYLWYPIGAGTGALVLHLGVPTIPGPKGQP